MTSPPPLSVLLAPGPCRHRIKASASHRFSSSNQHRRHSCDLTPPPNYAISGIRTQITTGQTPAISTIGTTTKSFDLQSFYFACIVPTQLTIGLSVDCTISLTDVKADSTETVGPLYLKFTSAGPTQESSMALGTVGGAFVGLSEVNIALVDSSVPPQTQNAALAIAIDDVQYTTY